MSTRLKELVIAAREVAFGGAEEMGRLQAASEAFAQDYEWEDEPNSLRDAVLELYMAGRWECPAVKPEEQARLWEQVRDAADIKVGTATASGVAA